PLAGFRPKVAPRDAEGSAARVDDPRQDTHQRGLARAVRSQQAEHAGGDLEVDAAERPGGFPAPAIGLGESGDFDHGRSRSRENVLAGVAARRKAPAESPTRPGA